MPFRPSAEQPRSAVVDLGSNSIRLVVFEGRTRNPVQIFNEKAVMRLGRGLQETGLLNEEALDPALKVVVRYGAIAKAMGAEPFEILATSAVRDASNGPAFVASIRQRLGDVTVNVISGEHEAELSAAGVLCGIPDANGILADVGGGSLELVRVGDGRHYEAATLKLGVLRLADRSRGDLARAREIAESDLSELPWLAQGTGRSLYLVGGAWRALARIHIAQANYPLNLVHHYTIDRAQAQDLSSYVAGSSRRALERMPGAPRRRIDDLPYAAVVLRRVIRKSGAQRIVFSANGLREGWYMGLLPDSVRNQDPMLAAGRDFGQRFGRDPGLPPALIDWTAPLFPRETQKARLLREAACWLSDVGSQDHPEYRASQSYFRVLTAPGISLDHRARAFLALVTAIRYDAEPDAPYTDAARQLLDPDSAHQATVLGLALRLAYTLSAGTPDLLSNTSLEPNHALTLHLSEGAGVFAGESVSRRLDRLGQALGLTAATELAT